MDAHEFVGRRFPKLGLNKKREIVRLLYEISKRDGIPPEDITSSQEFMHYHDLKLFLLQKRYPKSFSKVPLERFFLPKLTLDQKNEAELKRPVISPKTIYLEQSVSETLLAEELRHAFPEAEVKIIPSLKIFLKDKEFTISDYNRRTEQLFVVHQTMEYFEPCPCTKNAVHCGYNIMNLGFGCPYECVYCYLQAYQNVPGIILPANLEEFFTNFSHVNLKTGLTKRPRLGTGEFTDSLALDHITGYSVQIIEFFRQHPEVDFEFKTKSVNIGNILQTAPAPNIIVSWSLNPEGIIPKVEPLTASLAERLEAAKKCSEAGYKVGFHFDPLIKYETWQEDYRKTVDALFAAIKASSIAWISLGTLRFTPALKPIIETRFPRNTILDEELLIDFDGKMRYEKSERDELLMTLFKFIRNRSGDVRVYPCMEEAAVWKAFG